MPANSSSSWSIFYELNTCIDTTTGAFIMTIFTVICLVFLLPLDVLVLRLGLQRWWAQPSRTVSHSDLFTYHMVCMEILCMSSLTLICVGTFTDVLLALSVGYFLLFSNSTGQVFFHVLTCLERYLAIVHPITYLSLRSRNGIRARNVLVALTWLMSFATTFFTNVKSRVNYVALILALTSLAFTIIFFCSVSVLWVLTRPRPGDEVGSRRLVQRSKLRPFYTIMAILGALVIRFEGNIIITVFSVLKKPEDTERCALMLMLPWLSLPSNLVLPLLFLHRAGKLQCCRNNSAQDQRADP